MRKHLYSSVAEHFLGEQMPAAATEHGSSKLIHHALEFRRQVHPGVLAGVLRDSASSPRHCRRPPGTLGSVASPRRAGASPGQCRRGPGTLAASPRDCEAWGCCSLLALLRDGGPLILVLAAGKTLASKQQEASLTLLGSPLPPACSVDTCVSSASRRVQAANVRQLCLVQARNGCPKA